MDMTDSHKKVGVDVWLDEEELKWINEQVRQRRFKDGDEVINRAIRFTMDRLTKKEKS